MELYCTRPSCPRPNNYCADLDDLTTLKTTVQKYCTACGMPLLLDGRYVPIQMLGRGGFGAAFLARDRRIPGMPYCVVKQLQPIGNLSSSQLQLAQQLFTREAEVLAQLGREHEQIPELFADFPVTVKSTFPGKKEQFFYLVQEYIQGQNLDAELSEKGKFSEVEVLELLQAILPVLQFVHDKGIIHRDIKPSNIVRRHDGKLYLLDFGAVKQVTNVSPEAHVSTGIYTPGFAPPEQISSGQVFPATDLYALAVTVITLLTGEKATNLFDPQHHQWQWRSLVSINPHFADILAKMLLPAANQRFQSAEAVLAALSSLDTIPGKPQFISGQSHFSSWEILSGAAFSGFEGALIAIALLSLVKNPIIGLGISSVVLTALIFAQTQRWLEKRDFLIIPSISLAIIFFIPYLQSGMTVRQILMLASFAALAAISVTALFRLVYKFLYLIL
ncbi:serine/threonine protein kinase [Richelia sinica FACHB-800]|uniref:non-specific serine/threonine protein kinase n=1 Tax=Richelia sinica FACHB-800 TaxID=1357546 RepID=A0A975TCB5_9NOST|nr:serine/threonine-protein kinase [Richelia sinica]MBD2666667.1 serine/threonine protein kinase [Richelia sinica FACHB-800]QXE25286.1 serine/threonine protein kinase [Richelia sinica FACHB-800]